MRLLWTYFWQVSCRRMILVVLLYSFLWTGRLSVISLALEEDLQIGHTQEKADKKIIVHMKHHLLSDCRNVVVKTVHIDVITLLLAHLISSRFTVRNMKFTETLKNADGFTRLTMFAQVLHLSNSLCWRFSSFYCL